MSPSAANEGQRLEGHESLGAFARSVVAPRRPFLYVLHAVALTIGLGYWGGSFLREPELPLSVRVLYFPGGDTQYYPFVAALARGILGEAALVDSFRSGVTAFPLGCFPIHAALVAIFGDLGFVVGSALSGLLFYLCLVGLFSALGISDTWSRVGAILTAAGPATEGMAAIRQILPLPPEMDLAIWVQRFPRPMMSVACWLVVLTMGILLATRPRIEERLFSFSALGLALSLQMQSNVHATAGIAPAVLVVVAFLLARRARGDVRVAAQRAAHLVGLLLLGLGPFVVQLLLAHPDLSRRFGVFALPRLGGPSPPWDWHGRLALLLFLLGVACVCVRPGVLRRRRRVAIGVAGLVVVNAWGAMPLFALVTGKGVQLYHFLFEWREATSYVLVAALLVIAQRCAELLVDVVKTSVPALARWSGGLALHTSVGLAACAALWCVLTSVNTVTVETDRLRLPLTPRYKRDVTALVRELEQPRYASRRVLLTFDDVVYTHWLTSHRGFAFLPDPFLSTRPDAELEVRFMAAAGELGVPANAFADLVRDWYFQIFWLSHAKYVISRGHSFAPATEYPPETKKQILSGDWFTDWTLSVPPREVERLEGAYRRGAWRQHSFKKADLVVLTLAHRARGLAPGPDFERAYENPTFDVWVRR